MKNPLNFFGKKNNPPLPLTTPEFPHLDALNLAPDDQREVKKYFPKIENIAKIHGVILFSLRQANIYSQRTFGMSWQLRRYVWFFLFIICALINVQAIKPTVENNLPVEFFQLKPFVTIAFAAGLVFLLDWLIASELKNLFSRFDAQKLNNKLQYILQSSQGDLNKAFIAGQLDAFDCVQERYLNHINLLTWFKLLVLAFVYSIEVGAAIYGIEFYGENESGLAYIAPLLGVLMSGLSGLFRAITIEYSERRHGISHRYLDVSNQSYYERHIKDILLANTVTAAFLKHGEIDRHVVDNIKTTAQQAEVLDNFIKTINNLADEYHRCSENLTSEFDRELAELGAKELEWKENNLSVKKSQDKPLEFKKSKNRLKYKHLNDQLRLIEETRQKLKKIYSQYPAQTEDDCQLRQELAANKLEFQDQLARVDLEWQTLNDPQSNRSSEKSNNSQDIQDRQIDDFIFPN